MWKQTVPLLGLALLPGCGGGGTDPQAEVRAVVQRFGQATAKKDYQQICDRLVARTLSDQVEEVGLPCELAFKRGLDAVRDPRLTIKAVRVRAAHAFADVHSTAANQQASDDTLELTRERGGWRIASLDSKAAGPASPAP